MKNKKGFTLVELVIVIAVIAILAGVMIGTFASVVKKAKESAKMQEMTAQKQEQIANDIDAKLKNAEWLGWTDFEEKLADAVSKAISGKEIGATESKEVKAAVEEAVSAAFAKYAASIGQGNTGLTAEQVKYIVETALSNKSYSGVTADQVKAIINNATSGLSSLSKSQVQAIVDAAQAKNLTIAQVTAAIANATKDMDHVTSEELDKVYDKINTAISAAVKDLKDTTLTEADIEALLAKYISNGDAKGDYSWYNANATTMEITGEKAAEQVVALSTMAKGGTSFAGKTITIADDVDLTKVDFDPIVDFDGTIKGAEGKTVTVDVEPVWNTAEGRNGKTMMNYFVTGERWQKDAVAYGFVASLVDGGVIEKLNVKLAINTEDPGNKYTYIGGLVGLLDGGTIKNCTVTGTVTGYNRVGGVVGYAKSGTIDNVIVDGLVVTSNARAGESGYSVAGGLIGYASAGTVTIKDCKVTTTLFAAGRTGTIIGQLDNWKNKNSIVVTKCDNDDQKAKYKGLNEWSTGADTSVVIVNTMVNGTKLTNADKAAVNDDFGNTIEGKTLQAYYVTVKEN